LARTHKYNGESMVRLEIPMVVISMLLGVACSGIAEPQFVPNPKNSGVSQANIATAPKDLTIISADATSLVPTIDSFGLGWTQTGSDSQPGDDTVSHQISKFLNPPMLVTIDVSVFNNEEFAMKNYAWAVTKNDTSSKVSVGLGDESFRVKGLVVDNVFVRETNVFYQISVATGSLSGGGFLYYDGNASDIDPVHLARMIARKVKAASVVPVTPTPAITTSSLPEGRIVFQSRRDGNPSGIFVLDLRDKQLRKSSVTHKFQGQPAWSPTGTHMTFFYGDERKPEIYVADKSGNDAKSVAIGRFPVWSPDESRLAYSWQGSIYVVDYTGSNNNAVTRGQEPSWSPDGRKLAYRQSNNIFVIDLASGGSTSITQSEHRKSAPAWSPDGNKIAYESQKNNNSDIYIMDPDGSNKTRLTYHPAIDRAVSWSPDSQWIAFSSNRDGNFEIYIMRPDGSNKINLTNHPADDFNPGWYSLIPWDTLPPTPTSTPGLMSVSAPSIASTPR